MLKEMGEQPARLQALLGRRDDFGSRLRAVAPTPLHGVAIVARGSSDHAAVYGRYLLEAATGKPVSLAAPSLHTLYGIAVDYRGQLAIAVSQSGATPEIVTTLDRLTEAGAGSLAITNDPESDLAQVAGGVLELGVGEEVAVPATKTVTAQFMAFAILAYQLGPVPFSLEQLAAVPKWVQEVLADSEPADTAVQSLREASPLIVVARGFLYAAALETALKIKETCSLLADGYSAADLRHGPIAAVTRGFPVVAVTAPGPAHTDVAELVMTLRDRGANVLAISPDDDASLRLPPETPEALAPIVAVVRGQQLARALSRALGYEPDRPPGLSKVTAT